MTKRDAPRRARFERSGYLAIAPQALFELFDETALDAAEPGGGDVAVVDIRGPLVHHAHWWYSNYDSIAAELGAALAGPAKNVLLRIDSPGGEVSGLFEAAEAARAAVKASGKRVVAYVDGRACSAAYAWACVANEIVLPPSAEAGHVGVISTRFDATEAYRKDGIKLTLTTSGRKKSFGHPATKMSAEEQTDEQQNVDQLASLFFDFVASSRNLTPDAVSEWEAEAYLGQRAVDAGVADRVETFDQLMTSLAGANMADSEIIKALKAQAAGTGPEAKRAKAALAAYAAEDEKKDDDAEDESDEDKAEDEKKDDDAEDESDEDKAEDESDEDDAEDEDKPKEAVSAKGAGKLAAKFEALSAEVEALRKANAKGRMDKLLASRPDVSPELKKTLRGMSVKDASAVLSGIKRTKAKPAAAAIVPVTAPEGAGGQAARLPADQKAKLDAEMGLSTVESKGIEKSPFVLRLGVPVAAKKEG